MSGLILIVLYFLTLTAIVTAVYGSLQKEGKLSLYVILLSLAIAFFALGSLVVLASDNAETAFVGFRIQHIGQPFVGGLWFLFTMDVCGRSIKKKPLVALFMALPVIMAFGVTSGDPLHIFFASLSYGHDGLLPYVSGSFMPLYNLGLLHIYGFNVISSVMVIFKIFRPQNQSRTRLFIHFFAGLLPALAGITAILLGFPYKREIISSALCISSVILNLYLLKTGAFTISATALRTITTIFESNPHMNVMFDNRFKIIDCNPAAIEVMGFGSKEDFINGFTTLMSTSIPFLQMDGKPSLSMAEVLMITAKNGYYRDEIDLVIREEKRIFDLEIKRIPYGSSFAILGYMTELTERREKEDALAQRTTELEKAVNALEMAQSTITAMFESNPHFNVIFDNNLKVIDCNPAACTYMGFDTKEEMLAGFHERFTNSIPQFQPGGKASVSMPERLMTAVREGYSEFESELCINGKTVNVNIKIKRIPYGESFALVGYILDLTTERKRERELVRRDELLKEAIEEAQAANQAKSAFLANMSHEIRTPMNSIMGFAELAQDQDISPQAKDYLVKITDSTKWLLRIINDILDISKIESGKVELEKVPFDLGNIFMRCQSVTLPSINEKNLELRTYAEPPIGKKLLGDPVRLYQALINLLSNAVKFTNVGTVKMTALIKSADENHTTVYFEIKDSGIGMSPEQAAKIFEPFIQADSSTTRNYGGTGLGLSITKNIVELMGGHLEVESEVGVGSIFSFEIVFETIDSPDNESAFPESGIIEKPCFEGLILICEDNSINQQVICDHLASVGLQTVIAENGKIAVEMVQARLQEGLKPFDMIFMDIFMPVMDGIEAASKITALATGTPIVAMTANVMTGETNNYKKNGMETCVGKPFTAQELWRCLLKYLSPVGISVIDRDVWSKDSDELQKKLCAKFAKDNSGGFAKIAGAISAGDLTLAHRLAHTLKTNAGMIKKTNLQNAAAKIESLLNAGSLPMPELLNTLENELNMVLLELGPPPESMAEGLPNRSLDKEQVSALLEKLETMLENINPECANLVDDLRILPGTEKLVQYIEEYDFEAAAHELGAIKKELDA